jgi:hypothetical protein
MSHNIIQKRVAFWYEQSVTVAATVKAIGLPLGSCPAGLTATAGLR